jgi:hypothetical protein
MMFCGSDKVWYRSRITEIPQHHGGVPCETLRRCAPDGRVTVALTEGLSIDHQGVDQ